MTATWARTGVRQDFLRLTTFIQELTGNRHWSRAYEYPWVLMNGGFEVGQWVLDAAGGDGVLQYLLADAGCSVVNVDLDVARVVRMEGVQLVKGDLRRLDQFFDGMFDRVACVSVLEHTDDAEGILAELWRVLKPGGRLLVTMDVAETVRWNFSLDLERAGALLEALGMELPPEPHDILAFSFQELEPVTGEPVEVLLKVLCFFVDKEQFDRKYPLKVKSPE